MYGASRIYPVATNPADTVSDRELESDSNAETFVLPWSPSDGPITLVGKVSSYQGTCTATSTFTLRNVNFTAVPTNVNTQLESVAMWINGVAPPDPGNVFRDLTYVAPLPRSDTISSTTTTSVRSTSPISRAIGHKPAPRAWSCSNSGR